MGMDGYLNLFLPTFFLVGEWFLSVILILYIVYPLLNYLMRQSKSLTLLGLVALYILIFHWDFFGIPTTVNLIPCLLCLYIGMLLAHNSKLLGSPVVACLAAVCCAVFIPIPIGEAYLAEEILVGAALLLSLNYIGKYLCKIHFIDRFVTMVSRYGYYIFLVQHRLIIKVLDRYNPSDTMISLFLLIGIILAALVFSHNFDFILKRILKSRPLLKLEHMVMGTNR
jgi:hypothetical protein